MECDVIRDLIPLYAEDMLSDASKKLVEEHIDSCDNCKSYLDQLNTDQISNTNKKDPLTFLSKTLNKDRRLQGLMIGSFLLSIFLVIASFLTYPHPVEYKEGLVTRTSENNDITFNFSDEVTSLYVYPGYEDISTNSPTVVYLDGSYTYLDRILGGKSVGYHIDEDDEDEVDVVLYNNNGDNTAKVLYDPNNYYENAGSLILPRLALAYFVYFTIGLLIIFILLAFTLLKNKSKYYKIRLISVPVSYLLGNFFIKGTNLTSHHMIRDLVYILLVTLAIYLFIYSITLYFERKEKIKLSI